MKSSTIRRSTLSKESIEVIENLASAQEVNDNIDEYVRTVEEESTDDKSDLANKAQEIDLLWQSVKSVQFNSNSPLAYIFMGIVIGVVLTVLTFACIIYFSGDKFKSVSDRFNKSSVEQTLVEQQVEQEHSEVQNNVVAPSDDDNEAAQPQDNQSVTLNSTNQASQNNPDSSKMKKYVVKSGDTGESIIKKHYGSYSPEKADLIMKANNLKSLDRINIDQELLIPIE